MPEISKFKIGIVGLGVMGSNLALNMERNGYPVAGYDLDANKVRQFTDGEGKGKSIHIAPEPHALMEVLEKPRRILIMVPAGTAVDEAISHLIPYMEEGDILIDGGNSYFQDTERRCRELSSRGISFLGTGISGGEEGAKWGPAIMPGGQREAWIATAPIFRSIAAKAADGRPCVEYIGPRGAGHYVKMVHNGIEYGDMQLIAEIYDILHRGLDLNEEELHRVFAEWNQGELRSYLVEITAEIFKYSDKETSRPLVEMILDEAQQKGTGKWASQNALDIGASIPTIHAALEGRIISAQKSERVAASRILSGPTQKFKGERDQFIRAAGKALYASKVTSYAQGLAMLKLASAEYQYDFILADIAGIWRAGCIIRADLLEQIMQAYRQTPGLENLLLDSRFSGVVGAYQADWRTVVQTAVGLGIPVPALSASLAYYDAYRSERLPANLIQAQRDFFGAHTYRRIDREGVFHTQWTK